MKVLCKSPVGGAISVRNSWRRVLEYCGHFFRFSEGTPIHDLFSEFEPDVVIWDSSAVDRAFIKCRRAHPEVKVALFGSAWGPLVDRLDRQEYPIDYASDQEKRNVEESRPDLVFIHCVPSALEGVLGGWKSICPTGSVLNGADIILNRPGRFRPELACSASICTGWWPYKARTLSKYIIPLCEGDLDIKIFGWSAWPTCKYLGSITDADYADLVASTQVCLNVSEPHSQTLGYDIISRVFEVPAMGGFLLSDRVSGIDEVLGGGVIEMASTPTEYEEKLRHFLKTRTERQTKARKAQEIALGAHTGFERSATLMELLGLPSEEIRAGKIKFLEGSC